MAFVYRSMRLDIGLALHALTFLTGKFAMRFNKAAHSPKYCCSCDILVKISTKWVKVKPAPNTISESN